MEQQTSSADQLDCEKTAGLQQRIVELENSLKIFQAEMDVKMKIVEQIFITRNEQLLTQKKLFDREHILYESVLDHWKNAADLAVSGLSVHFTQDSRSIDVAFVEQNEQATSSSSTTYGKRSAAAARRDRRKRLKQSHQDVETVGEDSENSGDEAVGRNVKIELKPGGANLYNPDEDFFDTETSEPLVEFEEGEGIHVDESKRSPKMKRANSRGAPPSGVSRITEPFLQTNKGKPLLVHDGYTFVKHRDLVSKIHWRCSEWKHSDDRCLGRAHTVGDEVVYHNFNHNHVPNPSDLEKRKSRILSPKRC